MRNKKCGILVLVILMLVTVTGSLVSGTYAKYTAKLDDVQATAQVAKWGFKSENAGNLENIKIALADTVDASTLVEDRIAPGTKGSFDIALTNAESEVAVEFEIAIGDATNVPTNLKFCADETCTVELDTDNPMTGTLAAGDATGVNAKIYWVWDYEQADVATGDAADTTDGEAAAEMSVTVSVSGTQMAPSGTPVTSKIN